MLGGLKNYQNVLSLELNWFIRTDTGFPKSCPKGFVVDSVFTLVFCRSFFVSLISTLRTRRSGGLICSYFRIRARIAALLQTSSK